MRPAVATEQERNDVKYRERGDRPAPPRCRHKNVLWRSWTVLPLREHEDGIVWCRDCKRMVKVKR